MNMRFLTAKAPILTPVVGAAAIALISSCSTAQKMSDAQLESFGIRIGAAYRDVTPQLVKEGYVCFVSGAKRENFDCSKTIGVFPTCILRVRFSVDGQNKISALSVPDPACMGTP